VKKSIIYLLIFILLPSCTKKEYIRRQAPDFTLLDLNGQIIHLSDFKDKVIILDFFTTYCNACRLIIPNLNKIYQDYRKRGVIIVGISLDGYINPAPLRYFVRQEGILYPVLLGDEEIAKDYSVQVVPSIFIIDKNGYIRKRREGYQEISELEGAIEVLLRAPQTSAKGG